MTGLTTLLGNRPSRASFLILTKEGMTMSIKYAILGLLHYKDMHGYKIKAHIERNFGHMWSINYGQIYPNLKRLEEEGLVTKVDVPQADAPDRKLYSITQKGVEAFSRWLHDSPERQMLLRDPFLLRFVFFGFGDKERALKMIDEQIQSYQRQMEKRRVNLRRWASHDIYVRLMAELGVSLNEVMLSWLFRARKEIEAGKDDGVHGMRARLFAD
jgi:DNA-binding PadR family transcriptional regulator